MIRKTAQIILFLLLLTPLGAQSLSPLEFYEINCIEGLRYGGAKSILSLNGSSYTIRPMGSVPYSIESRLMEFPQSAEHYERYRSRDRLGIILGGLGAATYLYVPFMIMESQDSYGEDNMALILGSAGIGLSAMIVGLIFLEQSKVELSRSVNDYNRLALEEYFQGNGNH